MRITSGDDLAGRLGLSILRGPDRIGGVSGSASGDSAQRNGQAGGEAASGASFESAMEQERRRPRKAGPAASEGAEAAAMDATQTAAQGVTGYRAGMYGEVGVGSFDVRFAPEAKFGRMRNEATLAKPRFTGYSIDQFAERRGWAPPHQTMVSSQATFEYARRQAALDGTRWKDVRFETVVGGPTTRTYDVKVGPRAPFTEIKAGKSLKGKQLAHDEAAALNGRRIDYQFAGNPLTGHHGPGPSEAKRLDAANVRTGNNLTWGVADVAPTSAQMRAVENAAQVSRAARALGRVAAPIGVAADAYAIGSGIRADGRRFGHHATVAAAGAAGGWAGAAGGGWGGVKGGAIAGGVIGGPMGAAVGAVGGGLVGAIGGAFLVSWGAEEAARAATR